jgi:hypothetical protein
MKTDDIVTESAVSLASLGDDELIERRVRVRASDVVLVKGICEASEGLCAMFAEHGGDLVLAAPKSRLRELDELVADLARDFDAVIGD